MSWSFGSERCANACERPYCIVKGKARLGAVVHKKTATALALTAVKQKTRWSFLLVETIKASYNEKAKEHQRKWGGGIMGVKSQAKTAKRLKKMSKELGGESK